MVIFQILDCYSQDRKVIKETEEVKEVEYIHEDYFDDDVTVSRKIVNREYKQEYIVNLFGKTADNKSIHIEVENFSPYFYVELPNNLAKTYKLFCDKLLEFIETRKKEVIQKKINEAEAENQFEKAKVLKSIDVDTVSSKLFKNTEKEYTKYEKLYGYTNRNSFPFVKLSVSSLQDFRELKEVFLDEKNNPVMTMNGKVLKVYEANLDPMLRFFHLRNINPCGWASVESEYDENISVDWQDINPQNGSGIAPFTYGFWDIECYSESGDFPLAKKDYTRVAKQLSEKTKDFDSFKLYICDAITTSKTITLKNGIPVYSVLENFMNESSFKNAVENIYNRRNNYFVADMTKVLNKFMGKRYPIAGDPAIQIGIVFSTNKELNDKHIFVMNGSDPIEDVVVHNCKNEREMILGFLKLLNEKNPDILVGYNVFGFDMKYLHERMEELMLEKSPIFQNLSRVDRPVELKKKMLSSSALGDNTLYIWSIIGRLQIDLYFYIKRIENLASYKLDDVCRYYMSGKLKSIDVTKGSTWFIETKATSDAEVGKYLVLLDEIGDTIVDKRKIIEVVEGKGLVVEAPNDPLETNDLETICSWAIVKDDVSPAEIFRLHREGGNEGRAIVAKYCIQDCVLVFQLLNKLDVFNNAMAMANTCSVPISYIFTRGQGIKCESLIFKECEKRKQLIEVLPNPIQKTDEDFVEETYEGAIVLVPEPNFYVKSPIGVADFASLYPSSIISENISYDTLLWTKDYDNSNKFVGFSFGSEDSEKYLVEGVAFTDIEFDIWAPDPNDTRKNPVKIKTGVRICRYVQQPDDSKGTLPDILTKLLAARKSKRKEAEKESDLFRKALLDAEQLAYKLTANSLYGQLGSSTFKVRLQHLAASTTAYGRKQILFAKDAIESFYGKEANDPRCKAEIVYGDTDSLFVNFNVKDPETGELLKGRKAIEETIAMTEEAGKFVTRCLKKPHDFEYDKVFYPFIIFSKKRYVGNKYEDSPDNYKQTSMGIATKRRDYAAIVKNVYGGAIKILLNEQNPKKAFDFVQTTCNDLIDGKISEHQLTLTKSLRSEYKAATPPAHKILAERITLRDPGNAPSSGERIQFMYIQPTVGQIASKLQGDRIETPAYIKQHNLKIDYKYYIEHQIYNPITQLFGLLVEQMPGYTEPKQSLSIEEKEHYAGELLFKSIYAKCNNQNVRNFANKFGFEIKVAPQNKTVKSNSVIEPVVKKQKVINFDKLDRYLIKQHDEEKKKQKKLDGKVVAVDL